MKINNILNIRKSKIRIFPLQTRDVGFILYADLPTSYLLSLLIDKIGFCLDQFVLDYVYPTKKCKDKIIKNIGKYNEEYFIFYLENYFHSNDYAFGFLILVLDSIKKLKKKPLIIIHTIKTPNDNIKELIESYDFISLIVSGDLEDFFNNLFVENIPINEIANIHFRDDSGEVFINEKSNVVSDINKYILPAYKNGYYSYFSKSKDSIISILDDDDETTDKNLYYRKPREENIESFRYLPETSIMLTTGRGCKYNCSYCYRGVKYSSIRQISLDTIKKDLDYLEDLKYEYIYFYDDCFITTNLDRIDEIVELLSKYSFSYGISARFEVCSSDVLEKITKINISRIQIGLQSISIDVNKETKRGFNKKRFEDTLLNLDNLGIKVSLDLILGLPGEGIKGFLKTFNYAMSLNPISIYINTLFLNPGTELYEKQDEYGIITDNSNINKSLFHVKSIKSSDNFSEKDIKLAKKYISFYINKLKHINIILR